MRGGLVCGGLLPPPIVTRRVWHARRRVRDQALYPAQGVTDQVVAVPLFAQSGIAFDLRQKLSGTRRVQLSIYPRG